MLSPGPIKDHLQQGRESVIVKIGEQGRFHRGIKFGLASMGEALLKLFFEGH